MAVVDVAIAVGATVGLEGAAAGIAGGAILGAGVGAGYSLLTGDGNVLNSALTGAAIGGAGMGLAGAAGLGAAAPEAGAALTGTEAAASATPALQASAPAATSLAAENAAYAVPSASSTGTGLTSGAVDAALNPATTPSAMSQLGKAVASTGGKDLLTYGLAGTTALSMLGGQHPKGLSAVNTGTSSPQMIRPYTYSQVKNPNYGQPGEPYFTQSYTAQTPYKAAKGGIMHYAIGGGVENMYPQSQQEHTNFATPTQMPTSAEVVNADYDQVTNPYTGDIPRFADGGVPEDVQPATLVQPTTIYTPAPQQPTALQQQVADYNKGIAAAANQEYNVAPPPLANLPGGGQYASAPDLKKIINQYYMQNVGRPGEESGIQNWVNQVQNAGMSLGDVAKGIAGSNEGVVYQGYKNLLNRAPDAPGATYWTEQLQKGLSPVDFQNAIMGSQEYQKLHPTPQVAANQADIDAYLAANPTVAKVYNPITQTFSAPTVTQEQINTWKASQPKPIDTTMYTAPDGSLWTNKEAYDRAHPVGEAAGGLLGGYAMGGKIYDLGGYSDGGRLLKGPGDGMSDNIPASIGDKQPARLADGEFVVPADVVSHLGNGSTDAGAKRLYAMMDNVRKARTGSKKQGKQIKADKYLPT